MKTRNLLLALTCVATFTACTNNDEPAVTPAMRTVTLNVTVGEPADTRVNYTENEDKYVFAWTGSEIIRVFYTDTEDAVQYVDFSITGTYTDKQASFTGELPTGVTNVTIVYSKNLPSSDPTTFQLANTYNSLSEATYLYAENVAVSDMADVKLKHAASYLLLKEGLQIGSADMTTSANGEYKYYIYDSCRNMTFSSAGMTLSTGNVTVQDIELTNGKLTKDILIPFFVKEEGELNIRVQMLYGTNNGYKWYIGEQFPLSRIVKPGVVYEVNADNENWAIATIPT